MGILIGTLAGVFVIIGITIAFITFIPELEAGLDKLETFGKAIRKKLGLK